MKFLLFGTSIDLVLILTQNKLHHQMNPKTRSDVHQQAKDLEQKLKITPNDPKATQKRHLIQSTSQIQQLLQREEDQTRRTLERTEQQAEAIHLSIVTRSAQVKAQEIAEAEKKYQAALAEAKRAKEQTVIAAQRNAAKARQDSIDKAILVLNDLAKEAHELVFSGALKENTDISFPGLDRLLQILLTIDPQIEMKEVVWLARWTFCVWPNTDLSGITLEDVDKSQILQHILQIFKFLDLYQEKDEIETFLRKNNQKIVLTISSTKPGAFSIFWMGQGSLCVNRVEMNNEGKIEASAEFKQAVGSNRSSTKSVMTFAEFQTFVTNGLSATWGRPMSFDERRLEGPVPVLPASKLAPAPSPSPAPVPVRPGVFNDAPEYLILRRPDTN